MKKLAAVMAIIILMCLSGCVPEKTSVKKENTSSAGEIKGIWISFSELDRMMASGDFKTEFCNALDNSISIGITDAFVHVRPFCDSVYPSQYFPLRKGFENCGFDALEFMTAECHTRNIRFHAWINPYRVKTSDSDIQTLDSASPAYIWLNDDNTENDSDVCISNGVYLNPSSLNVRRLIMNGIREITGKYDVDGVHFDDYFYPTTDEDFDLTSYEAYKSGCKQPLSLGDWRRAGVNALISGCFQAVKFANKNIVFSVSPAASVEKNYEEYYADISSWVKSGCVDLLIPQLYFGFDYPDGDFRFEKLLNDWTEITDETQTQLAIGLAAYKVGTDKTPDSEEWQTDSTVLPRQVALCNQTDSVGGYVLFSYSSVFSEAEINRECLNTLKKQL